MGEVVDGGGAGEVEGVFGDGVACGDGADDLGAFDGVDSEVGFEVEVGFDDVCGVSGGVGELGDELGDQVGGGGCGFVWGGVGGCAGFGGRNRRGHRLCGPLRGSSLRHLASEPAGHHLPAEIRVGLAKAEARGEFLNAVTKIAITRAKGLFQAGTHVVPHGRDQPDALQRCVLRNREPRISSHGAHHGRDVRRRDRGGRFRSVGGEKGNAHAGQVELDAAPIRICGALA